VLNKLCGNKLLLQIKEEPSIQRATKCYNSKLNRVIGENTELWKEMFGNQIGLSSRGDSLCVFNGPAVTFYPP